MKNEYEIRGLEVTVSRLPDCVINELEAYMSELEHKGAIGLDYIHTLQTLIVGCITAWDHIDQQQVEIDRLNKSCKIFDSWLRAISPSAHRCALNEIGRLNEMRDGEHS